VANFVYAETGEDAGVVFERLLREGVIVRPLGPFGAEDAIRVTVGTPDENEFFVQALSKIAASRNFAR
jgi:histidinol-phosphate aminotransferase